LLKRFKAISGSHISISLTIETEPIDPFNQRFFLVVGEQLLFFVLGLFEALKPFVMPRQGYSLHTMPFRKNKVVRSISWF
jgi:hypothetical protein